MFTITRKIEFDAGHRVLGHQGRCRHVHGHRYVLELTVAPGSSKGTEKESLDALGMVIDFSSLKNVVGKWVDDNLDHNYIAHPDDPLLELDKEEMNKVFAGRPPFIMPDDQNPTAENLACLLYHKSKELLLPHGIVVKTVRLYETPNCWADFGDQ